MERKYYIDNLRWMAILLLFPFHAAQIWSGGEYSGFYIWSHTNTVLYVFSTAVYPWYMTLLFAIAGMSCKYALLKRTNKQFFCGTDQKITHSVFLWTAYTCSCNDLYCGSVLSWIYRHLLAALPIFYCFAVCSGVALPIYPKHRREKLRTIYAAVFVRILYPFGRKHSAKAKAISIYKFSNLHPVWQSIHLSVLFCKYPDHLDNRTLYLFRMDGNSYIAWHRTDKAELS